MSLLSLLLLSFAQANYFFIDDVIQVKEFDEKIQKIGVEIQQKTGWNLYLLATNDIGEQKLLDFQKEHAKSFQKPYIVLAFATKQGVVESGKLDKRVGKIGIYGTDGYAERIDREDILRHTLYPLLGAKVKSDPRNKYITVLYNGYAEIADQIADEYNVDLESSDGNANRVVINVLRFFFYAMIIGAFGIFAYQKYYKKER